jgi:hypothetical protein
MECGLWYVWILWRWYAVMWTGLVWLRIGTGGELLWIRYWNFGLHKMLGNYRVSKHLGIYGEVLRSMEVVFLKRNSFRCCFIWSCVPYVIYWLFQLFEHKTHWYQDECVGKCKWNMRRRRRGLSEWPLEDEFPWVVLPLCRPQSARHFGGGRCRLHLSDRETIPKRKWQKVNKKKKKNSRSVSPRLFRLPCFLTMNV